MQIPVNPSDTGIKHFSFSSVCDFLTDPRKFRKCWIDGDWSRVPELSLIQGNGFHAGLETYWRQVYAGDDRPMDYRLHDILEDAARKVEMEYKVTKPEHRIRRKIAKADVATYELAGCEIETVFGTTATGKPSSTFYAFLTPQSIMNDLRGDIEAYIAADMQYTPLAVETAITAMTRDEETGEEHPWPLKSKIDLVARLIDGRIAIVDHKYMSSDPDVDEEGNLIATAAMKLQGAAMVSVAPALLKELGIVGECSTVIFDVYNKKTGKMSSVVIEIGRKERMLWSVIFSGVQYKILVAYAMGDFNKAFLPNPYGNFGRTEGWHEFERDIEYMLETGEPDRPAEKVEVYEPVEL